MLSTWISSLNLPSVLSAQPYERKKINLSSSHTEADSWRLVSLSHSVTGQIKVAQRPLEFFKLLGKKTSMKQY